MGCKLSTEYPEICEKDVAAVTARMLKEHSCKKDAGDITDMSSHTSYGLVSLDSSSDNVQNTGGGDCSRSMHWTDLIELAILAAVMFWLCRWLHQMIKNRKAGKKEKDKLKLHSLVATLSGGIWGNHGDRSMESMRNVNVHHVEQQGEIRHGNQVFIPRMYPQTDLDAITSSATAPAATIDDPVPTNFRNSSVMKLAKLPGNSSV